MEPTRRTIRQTRKLLGMTQAELAGRIGISQVQLSNWENGRYRPRKANKRKFEELVSSVTESVAVDWEEIY